MFATPFVLVFPDASENIVVLELFTDVCFSIDILLNFFKLNQGQKEVDMKYITLIVVMLTLSSCALLNKLTGDREVAVPTPSEEIRG